LKVYKTLFWITFIAGLTIFSIGVYLKSDNQFSDGLTAGRYGNIHHGMITGFIGMFLGILILLLSIWTYRIFKKEKQKFDKME
jgi:hypothetical protein